MHTHAAHLCSMLSPSILIHPSACTHVVGRVLLRSFSSSCRRCTSVQWLSMATPRHPMPVPALVLPCPPCEGLLYVFVLGNAVQVASWEFEVRCSKVGVRISEFESWSWIFVVLSSTFGRFSMLGTNKYQILELSYFSYLGG